MPLHKREIFAQSLKDWFKEEKRSLPWRENPTPYRVWVSEVMLQQTQASVVIAYFERWMDRFPTIEALASAKEEEVLKLWEGLGYYSRARSLHQAAKMLIEDYQGELPQNPEELRKVKGIGPYTVGAIMSFAYHKKAAAVDGNVLRVISRLRCIEGEIDKPSVREEITEVVEELLPDQEPWVAMEALIELGAQVCKKKAACLLCPVRDMCLAYERGKVDELPKKGKRQATTTLHREVFVIECEGSLLIQQHGEGRVMAGLCEFPYIERGEGHPFSEEVVPLKKLDPVTHTFTRYKAHLYPGIFQAKRQFSQKGHKWVESKRLHQLAFSSGHRKILRQLLEDYANLTH